MNMFKTRFNNRVKWDEIDWRKVEKSTFKLQKRIYRAYESGDIKKGKRLQKTLINSYNSRLLSVRKVSQDNRGKATAGVDKVKSLTPIKRLAMAENLKPSEKAQPIRRVWIPKPGKEEKRLVWIRLLRWAKRRHPNKTAKWVVNKYWKTVGGDNWVFGDEDVSLYKHSTTPIVRHTKVKGAASPYDGNTNYWATRMGKHPEMSGSLARLLKKQKGKCAMCNITFREDSIIEKDHIIPKALGGNYADNIQLLHGHCHDEKSKVDLIAIKKHKAVREYQKFINKFNKVDWKWIDDIPTLVGSHKEPEKRVAV